MSTTTTRYAIPKPSADDAFADGDDIMRAMADRLDLLLGETGEVVITPTAVDTVQSVRVNYARSYAALAPMVPKVVGLFVNENRTVSGVVNLWSSGEDATGFTLNYRAATTATRAIRWNARAGG